MVSPVHGDYRRCQAEIPLIALSKFPRPALQSPALDLQKKSPPAKRRNPSQLRKVNWSRLSEQKFRVDKWNLCRG
jgi:hypothetical protein